VEAVQVPQAVRVEAQAAAVVSAVARAAVVQDREQVQAVVLVEVDPVPAVQQVVEAPALAGVEEEAVVDRAAARVAGAVEVPVVSAPVEIAARARPQALL
jgi:hypothetical protein